MRTGNSSKAQQAADLEDLEAGGDLDAGDSEAVLAFGEVRLGGEVQNGICKLLYQELQLHTPGRRASQVVLVQVGEN